MPFEFPCFDFSAGPFHRASDLIYLKRQKWPERGHAPRTDASETLTHRLKEKTRTNRGARVEEGNVVWPLTLPPRTLRGG